MNNVPMIKNEGILTKIKNWFKRLFSKEEIVVETVQEYTESDIEEMKRASFKEGLKIKSKEIVIFLQKQLEDKQIEIYDLTNEQLDNIIELYEEQIQEEKKILIETKMKLLKINKGA